MKAGDRVVLKLMPLSGAGRLGRRHGVRWYVVFDELPARFVEEDELMLEAKAQEGAADV